MKDGGGVPNLYLADESERLGWAGEVSVYKAKPVTLEIHNNAGLSHAKIITHYFWIIRASLFNPNSND